MCRGELVLELLVRFIKGGGFGSIGQVDVKKMAKSKLVILELYFSVMVQIKYY